MAWWRNNSLSEQESSLLALLFAAHRQSSFRPNISSVTIVNAAAGSGDLGKTIAAAILTLGDKHAPLEATISFLGLEAPASQIALMLEAKAKVPGWGGTFQKDAPDPIWNELESALHAWHPAIAKKLDDCTRVLHGLGKKIYPNPSAYTAAVCLALDVPSCLAVYLFIFARLDAWAQIFYATAVKKENVELLPGNG